MWWAGAIAQAFIFWTYFDLAPERSPSFETWGIVIGVLQVAIFVFLALPASPPRAAGGPGSGARPLIGSGRWRST